MSISDFDYELPEELIAQQPLPERDASRMLIIDRRNETWIDSEFKALPDYLRESDVLVLNNTRVLPARLRGRRVGSGGVTELLLLREAEPNVWEALTRPGRRLRPPAEISFAGTTMRAQVIEARDDGIQLIRFTSQEPVSNVIDRIGEVPLPPYIKRLNGVSADDGPRYQTIYATERGAVAAPTAGLHFTPAVLERVAKRRMGIAELTLHVGYGTFEPVRVEDVNRHQVLPEWFSISQDAASLINQARANSGRVVAVGTTTTRALESATSITGEIKPQSGLANLTIVPGYEFRAIDALLTNFHLPRSSLLLLVCAYAGRELTLNAYRHAVRARYRFFSYGDCMLIL